MTELLAATQLTDEQREFTEMVGGSGRNLLSIVNDILDFSRIDGGGLELEALAFDPGQLVEEVVDLLGETAKARVELTCFVDKDVGEGVLSHDNRRLSKFQTVPC